MALSIRDATPADAEAIARLHVDVWRVAYRDLAPPAVFEALDVPRRLDLWRRVLTSDGAGRHVLVAEIDHRLVGFTGAFRDAAPAMGGRWEVKVLYVATDHARRGIGRALLGRVAGRLVGHAGEGVALGVVTGNAPALAFYEALGGRIVGRYTDPGPLWPSDNLIVAWDDVAALAAACAPAGA